ncbi:hypothetical protein [Parasitella parasitica]|uniref:F-box domain-containing protein n=1 Tax=Parasitella parasitica TaxID=35722 RepID=A0A0B7NNG1_9FUNG|nr:hypothetical protein [Parasitella parasitica]
MLDSLPTEIIWNIMQALDPFDLSVTRLVSKKFNNFSDHQSLWRSIQLKPPITSTSLHNDEKLPLWSLVDLKQILQLHLEHIQTICIWGVRDNIIQYILSSCRQLQELTISGWSTLSNHAFRITAPISTFNHQTLNLLSLRRLRLIGQKKSNYTSLDAFTFGKLLKLCPYLEEITVVRCQIDIQAECLLQIVDQDYRSDPMFASMFQEQHIAQKPTVSSLKYLVIATKKTWSSHHVTRIFQLCPNLRFLGLVPDSTEMDYTTGANRQNNDELTPSMLILYSGIVTNNQPRLLIKNFLIVEDHEISNPDNLIIYKFVS